MRLAHHFGYANVDELLHHITGDQLDEWWIFYQLEPWGYKVENNRMGVVTATLANFIGHLTDGDALKPSDIFPEEIQTESKDVSPEAAATFGQMLKSLNG